MLHKACANLPGIEQLIAVMISYDHGIEGIARCVAANYKFLPFVNLVFNPGSASLARLVKRILALGDDTFESKFSYSRIMSLAEALTVCDRSTLDDFLRTGPNSSDSAPRRLNSG